MPLLDLKTDLKSLKYGQDRPGGGNSGQPYIQTDINKVDTGFNRFRMTKFDDGLVRGGFVGATNASVVDTIRIGKFLKDFPKGPLFIAKQVGLQLSNPRLEIKSGVTGFFQSQPTRIYNLGLNTLAQVPVNAFGIHLNRHGLLPVQDDQTKYLAVAQSNNQDNGKNNRLVKLANELLLENFNDIKFPTPPRRPRSSPPVKKSHTQVTRGGVDASLEQKPSDFAPRNRPLVIQKGGIIPSLSMKGGPNSVYGIGVTNIRRGDVTNINQKDLNTLKEIAQATTQNLTRRDKSQNLDRNIAANATSISQKDPRLFVRENFDNLTIRDKTAVGYNSVVPALRNYSALVTAINQLPKGGGNSSVASSNSTMYGLINTGSLYEQNKENNKLSSNRQLTSRNVSSTGFSTVPLEKITYFNGIKTDGKDEVVIVKTRGSWSTVARENRVGSGRKDQINLTPVFSSPAGTITDSVLIPGVGYKNINDLVKFRIQALNGNNPSLADWMIFRAYITQFTDTTDATWNPIKYAGRGEDFYVYNGFTRKISINFKVAALSAEEMEPMYQKLNYLMGNVMPDYNAQGLMRGPLVRMTVGNWIDGQAGILTSVGYTIPNESPWEIAINEPLKDATGADKKVLILPHIVEVQLSFTPIGSQTKGTNLISEKSFSTSHIAQNINDYQYIKGNIKPGVSTTAIVAAAQSSIRR